MGSDRAIKWMRYCPRSFIRSCRPESFSLIQMILTLKVNFNRVSCALYFTSLNECSGQVRKLKFNVVKFHLTGGISPCKGERSATTRGDREWILNLIYPTHFVNRLTCFSASFM